MQFENNLEFARQLDKEDKLKYYREKFIIPAVNGKQQIYFLGNSLGLQPIDTKKQLQQVLDAWSDYGVEGFFKGEHPWMHYHDALTQPLSVLAGAGRHEIVVMHQLTINLHLLLASFYQPKGKRTKIICEAKAFPSDQYMMETHVRHHGLNPDTEVVEVLPRAGEHTIRTADIVEKIEELKEETALVLFSGINYYTGQLFDMKTITQAAHAAGAKAGFDLAHAIGNVSLHLHNWNVDFACWCSYKYLNSGPGAVGGAYIHERYHRDHSLPRLAGWWGYEKETRFQMQKGFKPIDTAEGWQVSTPSPLLFAAHKAALDLFEQAGWEQVQEKSSLLTAYLWFMLQQVNEGQPEQVIEFITPANAAGRGCQVSMHMLQQGKLIFDALAKAGVMLDWREPNVIRLAPAPLYNSFEEVWQFTNILQQILQQHAQHA